jgi:hypothetical protein
MSGLPPELFLTMPNGQILFKAWPYFYETKTYPMMMGITGYYPVELWAEESAAIYNYTVGNGNIPTGNTSKSPDAGIVGTNFQCSKNLMKAYYANTDPANPPPEELLSSLPLGSLIFR